jgi:hypothetical protein
MDDPETIIRALIQIPQSTISHGVLRVPDVNDAQKISLQRDLVAALAKRAEASFGDSREYGGSQATYARLELISMLLNAGDLKGAATEWSLIPTAKFPPKDEVELRLASKTGGLNPFSANRCSSSAILETPTRQQLQLGSQNPRKRV